METPFHSIVSLFDQLGLDSSDKGIDEFIAKHKPLQANIDLSKAEFWNDSQAAFLKQEIEEDADWAELVDQLDAMLRE
jgi:hypothetical protein